MQESTVKLMKKQFERKQSERTESPSDGEKGASQSRPGNTPKNDPHEARGKPQEPSSYPAYVYRTIKGGIPTQYDAYRQKWHVGWSRKADEMVDPPKMVMDVPVGIYYGFLDTNNTFHIVDVSNDHLNKNTPVPARQAFLKYAFEQHLLPGCERILCMEIGDADGFRSVCRRDSKDPKMVWLRR